jgi:hypothetical protein
MTNFLKILGSFYFLKFYFYCSIIRCFFNFMILKTLSQNVGALHYYSMFIGPTNSLDSHWVSFDGTREFTHDPMKALNKHECILL